MQWNATYFKKLADNKWLHITYDAMIVELILLVFLELTHGKNLAYLFDLYPIGLFLFMLPLVIATVADNLQMGRKHNDRVLLISNLFVLIMVAYYILFNYTFYPARFKTGGYALLGDSTIYTGHHDPAQVAIKSFQEESGINDISISVQALGDSMFRRYNIKKGYELYGINVQPDAIIAGKEPTYTGYALFRYIPDQYDFETKVCTWHITYHDSITFIQEIPFNPTDTLSNIMLKRAIHALLHPPEQKGND